MVSSQDRWSFFSFRTCSFPKDMSICVGIFFRQAQRIMPVFSFSLCTALVPAIRCPSGQAKRCGRGLRAHFLSSQLLNLCFEAIILVNIDITTTIKEPQGLISTEKKGENYSYNHPSIRELLPGKKVSLVVGDNIMNEEVTLRSMVGKDEGFLPSHWFSGQLMKLNFQVIKGKFSPQFVTPNNKSEHTVATISLETSQLSLL